ncbi:MAG: glycosyltransferase [Spirochaetes bacterium]|nr:glycosyltransferase [Spirochaetota bacterium]
MKLLWASQLNGIGMAYGFTTHARQMLRALREAGVSITFNPHDDYDLAVHIIPPELFKPIPGRRNLLLATCEASEPTSPFAALPDVLIVPCNYNREVFAKHFAGPIEVCPEGIDPALFPLHQRHAPGPGESWRFLFHGNMDGNAKGSEFAVSSWRTWMASGRMPGNAELYLHTTGLGAPPLQHWMELDGKLVGPVPDPLPPTLPKALADRIRNLSRRMTLDNRDLSAANLTTLYNSAHALLSTSLGEGWNLVLTEAMATGLPCAWSHHTAMLDYADQEIGFPITEFKPFVFRQDMPEYFGLAAEEPAIIAAMEEIVRDYPAALERGRKASERMHSRFTWAQAASKFIAICEKQTSGGAR